MGRDSKYITERLDASSHFHLAWRGCSWTLYVVVAAWKWNLEGLCSSESLYHVTMNADFLTARWKWPRAAETLQGNHPHHSHFVSPKMGVVSLLPKASLFSNTTPDTDRELDVYKSHVIRGHCEPRHRVSSPGRSGWMREDLSGSWTSGEAAIFYVTGDAITGLWQIPDGRLFLPRSARAGGSGSVIPVRPRTRTLLTAPTSLDALIIFRFSHSHHLGSKPPKLWLHFNQMLLI